MSKIHMRQEAIAQLISKGEFGTQGEIVESLLNEFGIATTQAIVSRDLKQLGAVKALEQGKRVFRLPEEDVQKRILGLGVSDIQHNEALIVITTLPGLAPFIGDAIDASDLDILGCISGENTIFVTPKTTKNIQKVFKGLCLLLNFQNA